jgi:hypothetical protein
MMALAGAPVRASLELQATKGLIALQQDVQGHWLCKIGVHQPCLSAVPLMPGPSRHVNMHQLGRGNLCAAQTILVAGSKAATHRADAHHASLSPFPPISKQPTIHCSSRGQGNQNHADRHQHGDAA